MGSKAGAGCLGWLVAGALLVALIGKCAGDPSTSADPASSSGERLTVQYWRYVQPASAHCRALGSTSAASLARLDRNDFVGVLKSEEGWSLVDRAVDCWVRDDLLGSDRAAVPVPIQALASYDGGSDSSSSSRRSSRGSAYYRNCAAARAAGAAPVYRGDPGYARRLDRDGDGVGCE